MTELNHLFKRKVTPAAQVQNSGPVTPAVAGTKSETGEKKDDEKGD